MGLRIKERQEKKQKCLQLIEEDLIKREAKRYGGSSPDSDKSEDAFLYKIKAIRSYFRDPATVQEAAEGFVRNLKNIESLASLPHSKIEPSLLLELL